MLRSRKRRREEPLKEPCGGRIPEPIVSRADGVDPSTKRYCPTRSASRCWWYSKRLLPPSGSRSCCTTCSPCLLRRSLPSWGGSPTAARQLASRARRRVQGEAPIPDADLATQREVVDAFLAASRDGDFDTLLAVLDPGVVLRIDGGAVRAGLSREIRGARAVSEQTLTFSRLSPFVRPALVNGAAGVVVAPRGRPFSVMGFTIRGGKIVEIDILADPARLSRLDVSVFGD